MILQVEIKDNEYKSWTWREIGMRMEINVNLNPLELKLFHGDLVEEDGKLIGSKYRNTERGPAVRWEKSRLRCRW